MDAASRYILMCERAEEIQTLRRYKDKERDGERNKVESGDFYFATGSHCGDYETGPDIDKGDIYIEGDSYGGISMDYPNTRVRPDGSRYSYDDCPFTWLPRQDQLQEMIDCMAWRLEQKFHHWFLEYSDIKPLDDKITMEQLWLAFVMKEKYNKVWNGKDWVKK